MFDQQEGYDAGFFSRLVLSGIGFVTWQKNVNAKEMAAIDDKKYKEQFEFNGKSYAVFEDEKIITYLPGQDSDIGKHCFKLRHLFIWNKSSKRRTGGVALARGLVKSVSVWGQGSRQCPQNWEEVWVAP